MKTTAKKFTKENMFEPMREALPAFRPQWEAFVEEWTPKPGEKPKAPDGPPHYLLLWELAAYLTDLLEKGQGTEVVKALGVAERWILEGEHYVGEAAVVGLLEDLQKNCKRRKIDEARFTALLGPEGRFWWKKLDGFWNKGGTLVDDRKLHSPPENPKGKRKR